ncbi:hypothetical protein BD410DRAFT_790504 [Rickenella mellea]|uniref:F-box domain-containing protein n=1 Tax=Rickenella mellea TaxID=50990 RepID=A0A4Y7PZK2_9AGAM|nr:hypothetical protein BD410DRAFT_790504 [Rickenella mellea]
MEPGNQSTDIELSLASAPNLRFLFLHAPGCKIVSPHTLPFLNLREVKVDSDPIPIPAADVLALLRLSPAVEVVYACVLHTHNRSDSGNDILNLAHLKDLKILEWLESGQEGHVLCPLEELNSPALERLSFKVAVNGPQDPSFLPTYGPQLRSLIFRSRPPVTVLKIQWCRIPAADLMYSIPFLPNLVCIDIEFIGASDDWDGVLELLTGPVPPSDENLSGCMCPQLNEIFLGRDNKANPDLVADMICSRSPVGCSKLLPHPKIKDCIVGGMQYLSGGRGGDWGYPDSNDL